MQAESPATIAAGRLGTLHVRPGAYLYAGSALGPGGVRARVLRHARTDKRPHWHVDHLTPVAPLVEAWFTHDPRRLECDLLAALASIRGAREPWPGFGASDCGCSSHLRWFGRAPAIGTFRTRIREQLGEGVRVGTWRRSGWRE